MSDLINGWLQRLVILKQLHNGLTPPYDFQHRPDHFFFLALKRPLKIVHLGYRQYVLLQMDVFNSHEIKRCLLLGKNLMTNLDSILKSRDITLSAKVRLVKAIVFPEVMYRSERWTVKKAECQRIDAFEL